MAVAETLIPNISAPALKMSAVGRMLRETREIKGLSLGAVADRLRIRKLYIEALEEGRYEELPAEAYVTGFIRSYAKLLGLNGVELVARYRSEGQSRPSAPVLNMPSPITEQRMPTLQMLLGGALVALAIFFSWSWLVVPQPELAVDFTAMPPAEIAAEIAGLPEALPISEAANNNDIIPNETIASEIIPSATSVAASAITEASPVASPVQTSPVASPVQTTPVASPVQASPVAVRVAIRAIGDGDIHVKTLSGATLLRRSVTTGDVVPLPLRSDLRLDITNAGAVRVVMDGRVLPEFGEAGEPVRNINLDPAAWDLPPIGRTQNPAAAATAEKPSLVVKPKDAADKNTRASSLTPQNKSQQNKAPQNKAPQNKANEERPANLPLSPFRIN